MGAVHGLRRDGVRLMGHNPTMDHAPLAQALAERLPGDEHIRRLFAQVPRHRFLPDIMWGPDRTSYDRTTDPDEWLAAAYTDQALTTQRDDGHDGGMGVPSSSSSAPSVMARMLTAARIAPTHRILEVGTGTGFNAALLCQLLGSSAVTTIEIDQDIAAAARSALYAHGVYPTVLTGDAETYASGRPPEFDRVIATCTVSRVPSVWVRQMRSHGRIVTPWAPTPGAPGGVLAVLDTTHGTAEGRFEGGLSFMWARGQRWPGQPAPDPDAAADHTETVSGDPRGPWLDGEQALLLSLLMPGWTYGMRMAPGAEEPHVWLSSTTCAGWARIHADGRVEQGGGRRLVDEAGRAWQLWQTWDCPTVSDCGLTVDLDRGVQTVWVHGPQHALWSTRR